MTTSSSPIDSSSSPPVRTALVTGASRGIGATIAKELIASGHRVIGTATSQAGADAITTDLAEYAKATTPI